MGTVAEYRARPCNETRYSLSTKDDDAKTSSTLSRDGEGSFYNGPTNENREAPRPQRGAKAVRGRADQQRCTQPLEVLGLQLLMATATTDFAQRINAAFFEDALQVYTVWRATPARPATSAHPLPALAAC